MSQPSPPPSSKIFISYRRNDTAGHAGRLYDRLAAHFGEEQIFMDIEHIEPGVDFVEAIREAVGSCVALIVLIGRDWLDAGDENGRRLDDPNDFVRLEVGAALERSVRVIPVLVQGAVMPRPQALPESLVGLSRRNAVELSDTRWKYDVDELIATLDRVLARQRDERLKAAEAEDQQRAAAAEAERERREAEAAEARRHEAEETRRREAAAAEAARLEQQEAARSAEAERRKREEATQREREEAARREKEEAARREAEAERLRREAAARREEDLRRERVADEERRGREAEEAERQREEDGSHRAAPFADYNAPPPQGRKTLPLVLGGLAVAAVGVAVVVFLITRPSAPDAEKASLTASVAPNELAQQQPQQPAQAAAAANSNTAPQSKVTATPHASPTRATDGKATRPAAVVEVTATTPPSTPRPTPTPTPAPTPPPPTPTPAPKLRTPIFSGGVLNGRLISKPSPVYPAVAKAARASGTVVVQITVDEGGAVISAAAVSGHPLLRQAAVQAAYQARFSPTLLSGQPVKVTGTITYNFNLQ